MAYYLPINSTSLAHYFACACIKPARYFENKPQDIQDKVDTFLLLSTVPGAKGTDCCLELALTDNEIESLIACNSDVDVFLCPYILPISRVKKVYFKNDKQLELTLSNINLSTAYIPSSLAEVSTFADIEIDVATLANAQNTKDYSANIDIFNRILGALALMKIAREHYMNYSENYASTLSFFNSKIKKDLERQGISIKDKFHGLFSRSSSFQKFLPYLEKKITKDDLNQIAFEDNQKIERSFSKVILLDKLNGKTYAFAVLQSYGVGGEAATQKIDKLISTNFAELKEGTAEGIALYYGYNRGYSVFSNAYGTEETKKQSVKFLLNSQLDYYIIESVYQFAFNGVTTSDTFSYIDTWCPKNRPIPRKKTDYIILDTLFVGKKKVSVFSKEYLRSLLDEIKSFDCFNNPLSSLIEKVREIVANDAKDELEDGFSDKIFEYEKKYNLLVKQTSSEIESLKGEIDSRDGIICDLQKQNEELLSQIEQLKTAPHKVYENVEVSSSELEDSGHNNGLSTTETQNDASIESSISTLETTNIVSGYSSENVESPTTNGKGKTTGTKRTTRSRIKKSEVENIVTDIENNSYSIPTGDTESTLF